MRTAEATPHARFGWSLTLALLALAVVAVVWALSQGSVHLDWAKLLAGQGQQTEATILWEVRLPRVLLGFWVGASLAAAGLGLQALMRNPLVDPYLMGVSSGGALGGALVILSGMPHVVGGLSLIPLAAMGGGLGVVALVFALGHQGAVFRIERLILAGVAVSAMASAVLSGMLLWAGEGQSAIVSWLLGNLTEASWEQLGWLLPYGLLGGLGLVALAKPLALLALGEREAAHLGVSVARLRRWTLLLTTLLAAAAVSVCGVIGFIGLIAPHGARLLCRQGDPRRLLLPAALLGGILLVVSDTLARTLLSPQEIPVGLFTALLGAPFFLLLLRRA